MNYFLKTKKNLKSILLFGLPLALSACGPMYDTSFNFEPPKSEIGLQCTYQCSNVKSQCMQLEEMKKENCSNRVENSEYQCEQDIRYRLGREPKWYECGKESCTDNSGSCDEQYRACYQACGGRVTSETRCVANCPAPGSVR